MIKSQPNWKPYCDVRDYVNARRFADRAYARIGGGSSGYETELSLVYKRLNFIIEGGETYDF